MNAERYFFHPNFQILVVLMRSAASCTDLKGLSIGTCAEHQPLYWIHSHIHTPTRYTIGNTEIICNPHGYLNEKYNGYEKDLIIEI
ncbi:hypothetical protein [Pedobacter frigidisoli]|uniref:hypothetical protein n=1 Tax=Pedobacter frigidisoli TaxID=2530455 RepID=UPI00198249A5|nr:hypothetical protein [Pedobacter frigidisoli]